MNKREFIKAVAVESRQSTVYVAATLDAMMKIFTVCMEQGIKLSLTGFGSFSVHEHPARKGRNPHTGGGNDRNCSQENCQVPSQSENSAAE